MPVLFAMSIAGSIPLIGCLFLWIVFRTDFPAKWGLRLLRISIFFYLVPFQLIRHIMPDSLNRFIYQWDYSNKAEIVQYSYKGEFVIPYQNHYIWIPRWIGILAIIWLFCIICFAIYQCIHYLHFMKIIKNPKISNIQKTHLKNVSLLVHSASQQPFSIGFFKSYIIMPRNLACSEQQDYIYRHELSHVQRHDAVFKLLCLIIMCLHWFNPLSLILQQTYSIFCEYASDDSATAALSPESLKEYSILLVELSTAKDSLPFIWSNNFLNTKQNLQRRISRIMKKRSLSISQKILIFILTFLLTLASSITLLAYSSPKLASDDPLVAMEKQDGITYDYEFTPSDTKSEFDDPCKNIDFSLSDIIWQLEDGSIIPIYSQNFTPKKSCVHQYLTGTRSNHIKNSSGGCTVSQYKVTRCTNCGYEKNIQLLSTTSYPKCPHK